MADTVRYVMEDMIPELEDLQKRGYFSKQELKEIVRKREKFEYLLKRRAARKEDYLGYVEYEKALEELRALRKKKLQIKGKKSLADHAVVKRIHFIFQRATRKFKSDLQMWLQWLDFCKQTDSGKLFSKVVTRALRLHPHCAALWSFAAAWEFEHNGNASAARLLMQQGLRVCKHEPDLWVEYFRMELMYVRKLRARRKVLGLDVPGKKAVPVSEREIQEAGTSGPDITLQEAAAAPTVAPGPDAAKRPDNAEAEAAAEAILKGAVAMVVLRNAIAALPDSLHMRQRLLEVVQEFKFPGVRAMKEFIYKSVETHFHNVEEGWDLLARRHSHAEASVSAADLDACCSVYEQAVKQLPSSKMYRLYAAFLREILTAKMADAEQIESAALVAKKLLSVFKQAHQLGIAGPAIYLEWHHVAQQLQQPKVALNALRFGCQSHPSNTELWTLRLQQEAGTAGLGQKQGGVSTGAQNGGTSATAQNGGVHTGAENTHTPVDGGVAAELQAAVREALSKVPAHEGASVWKQALLLMGGSRQNMEQLQHLFLRTLMACSKGPTRGGLGEVAGLFLTSLQEHSGLDAAREFFRQLTKVPCAGGDMFRAMVALDQAALSGAQAEAASSHVQHLKLTFEAAVAAYGREDADMWVQYAIWIMSRGNGSGDVYWRATKALDSPDEFVEKMRQLQQL